MNEKKTNKVKTASLGLSNLSPKTIAAIALVSLMLMLWMRVLLTGKNGPKAAKAQSQSSQQDSQAVLQSQTTADVEVVPAELTVVTGRNDRLTNNVFSAENWKAFEFHKKVEKTVAPVVQVTPQEDPQEKIRKAHQANLDKISKTLTLEAVIHGADGKPSKVFVDEKILTVGTVLTVQEGPETYELMLTELNEKEALFTWDEFSMVLRITETVNQ